MPSGLPPSGGTLAALAQTWQTRPSLALPELAGSAPAFLIAGLARQMQRPLLVLTAVQDEAERVKEEISFYLDGKGECVLHPARSGYDQDLDLLPGEKTASLARLLRAPQDSPLVLVAPALALLARTITPEMLLDHTFEIAPGQVLDREPFLAGLIRSGYASADTVREPGEFSARGGILDVFAAGAGAPIRIELSGDEIESLRAFDPESQRSAEPLTRASVPPLREVILDEASRTRAELFLQDFGQKLKEGRWSLPQGTDLNAGIREMIERFRAGTPFPGLDLFLAAYAERPASLVAYLDQRWAWVALDPFAIEDALARTPPALEKEWTRLIQGGAVFPPPEDLFIPASRVETFLRELPRLFIGPASGLKPSSATEDQKEWNLALEVLAQTPEPVENVAVEANDDLRGRFGPEDPLEPFKKKLREWEEELRPLVLVSPTPGKAERLQELLSEHGFHFQLLEDFQALENLPVASRQIVTGQIRRGFRLPSPGLAVVTEEEIFGEKIRPRLRRERMGELIQDLSDLSEGDPVVHLDHGIGLYRGLISLAVQALGEWDYLRLRERPRLREDCLVLEYRDGDKLYLPVHRLNLIQKYRGPDEAAPVLDKLGGEAWEKSKQKVRRALLEMAEELLEIHAARQVFPGHAYSPPDHEFREFEAGFEYEETPDQLQAIEDVLEDLQQARPMDRLVCGDVGYGKTEVAIRAAFKVAMEGRQVAVLVPTTILAQQHFHTFFRRLQPYPIEIRVLSRFRTAKEQKETLRELKRGTADIVIGTHRLLSKDVEFHDLGLAVVDEEHRFGVAHKEKLKKLKKTVDVLTLTATPIPRTLNLSLLGLRDLSIMDTPPADRQAIHTELARFDPQLIREAVLREFRRQGQVFYVINRVQEIEAMAGFLHRLLPEARLAVAHGQMHERSLEKVMREFVEKKYDLLVTTAIIESGLDIPSANTMLVHRADQFGLAQLYQLRGRIGRSKERGYAYFLIPGPGLITPEAAKRLKALKEFTELGSGFRLAGHDLQIRGAGNILGRQQSGHLARMGFELYSQLLHEAIQRLKGEEVLPEIEPELKLQVPAYLPESYIPSAKERLSWYKRFSMVKDESEIKDLREELLDRYGPRPEEVENLAQVMAIKALLKQIRALGVEYNGQMIDLNLGAEARVDPDRVLALVHSAAKRFRLTPDHRLYARHAFSEPAALFAEVKQLLNQIAPARHGRN